MMTLMYTSSKTDSVFGEKEDSRNFAWQGDEVNAVAGLYVIIALM